MADTSYHSPFMGSVTATNVKQQLLTLLQAVFTNIPIRACFVQIQFDNAATGNLYIGNSAVTSVFCGANLVATQAFIIPQGPSNLVSLADVYVLTSAASGQINVTVLTR